MKILITGATGFVGEKLLEVLSKNGHELVVTSRNVDKAKSKVKYPCKFVNWNPTKETLPSNSLAGVDAVINLMGAGIADARWSESRKKEISDSRIIGTKNLIRSLKESDQHQVKTFVSTSAVGYYGDRGYEKLDETSSKGEGFLSDLCDDWEKALGELDSMNIRKAILRVGIVLDDGGGALTKMLPPFLLGGGGRLGSGKQYMSWIHREDLARMYAFAVENDNVSGILNATAPIPVTNTAFTKVLARVVKRPAIFPVPSMALKILLGEMAEMLLGGQQVIPERVIELGFEFNFKHLEDCLRSCLRARLNGELVLDKVSWVNRSREEVFKFFSNEKNLEEITPKMLNFKVVGMSTDSIQKGTLIDYKLKIRGIPARWQSEIEQWEPNEYFVDRQVIGPYSKWHHLHTFHDSQGGTLVCDRVHYKIPGGILGKLILGLFIKSDLEKIFKFRETTIERIFHGQQAA